MIATHLKSMTRVDLVYILSSYAKAGVGSQYFFAELIKRLIEVKDTLNAIDMTNVVQGLAKLRAENYLAELAPVVLAAKNIRTKDLCLIVNAYSLTKVSSVFFHFEREVIHRIPELDAQQIALVVNSFCNHIPLSPLFSKMEERICSLDLDAQTQANVLHAYGKINSPSEAVYRALAPKLRLSSMNVRELVQVYWSYTRKFSVAFPCEDVEAALVLKKSDLTGQAIATVLNCQAKFNRRTLLDTMMELITSQKQIWNEIVESSHHLIKTMHALTKYGQSELALKLLAAAPSDLMERVNESDFAVLLYSTCKANAPRTQVAHMLTHLPKHIEHMSEKHIINIFYQLSRDLYEGLYDLKGNRHHFDRAVNNAPQNEDTILLQIAGTNKFLDRS